MIKGFKYPVFLTFFILTGFLLSCGNSADTNNYLQGEWHISKAYRNGRKTVTLEKVYFKFWNLDSLQTNFTGQDRKFKYIVRNDSIVIDGDYPSFKIVKKEDNTLAIQTSINGHKFKLILKNNDKDAK